jgi:LPXTG-motif cell wall-anchored protein
VEPDDEGNLVPVEHVAETIAVDATPSPLPIVDPEGDAWTVRIQSGVLPSGITMNDQGVFTGITTETGTFNLTMETCDDRTPPACSTFTYTLTVEPSLPATGIETVHIGIAGLIALLLGSLVLVITSRRRNEKVQAAKR